jgi:hypothetical protein
VLDFLLDAISGTPTTYLVAAGIVLVDDFIPFASGDTAMITAGIVAAHDELSVLLPSTSSTITSLSSLRSPRWSPSSGAGRARPQRFAASLWGRSWGSWRVSSPLAPLETAT